MWLFTKSGFFSAVQHRQSADVILLRARFKGDLEKLFETYWIESKVEKTPCADYPFRACIQRKTWERIVAAEASKIDYDNFKAAAHDGTPRDDALMRCWSAMRAAQDPVYFR